MKLNAKKLPLLTAALGILTLVLRAGLYLLGIDEKGLLVTGHPLNLLSWGVTASAVLLILAGIRPLKGSSRYQDNFAPSTAAAIGAFAMAGGMAVTVILGWGTGSRMELIRNLCGILGLPALIGAGLLRWQGKQPPFFLHALVCLYLILYSVSHYQIWCSRPQLQDYAFTMAGILLLTLFAYYQTAFDAGLGRRRGQLLTGLGAGFFCLAALAGGEDAALYLGGAVWSLTGLCRLTAPDSMNTVSREVPHEPA